VLQPRTTQTHKGVLSEKRDDSGAPGSLKGGFRRLLQTKKTEKKFDEQVESVSWIVAHKFRVAVIRQLSQLLPKVAMRLIQPVGVLKGT